MSITDLAVVSDYEMDKLIQTLSLRRVAGLGRAGEFDEYDSLGNDLCDGTGTPAINPYCLITVLGAVYLPRSRFQ